VTNPFAEVVATARKLSLTLVAELVAFDWTHPTEIVDVELALFVTVSVAPVVPAPTVKPPDNTVELAVAFLRVSPDRRVNCVVVAPPRKVASPVTLSVLVVVIAPPVVMLVLMVVVA